MITRVFISNLLLLVCAVVHAQPYSFRHLTNADGLLSEHRFLMDEDRMGRLWIGSDEGITVFDGYELTNYTKDNNSGLLHNLINQVFCDRQGTMWIATPAGIQYRRENERTFKTLTNKGTAVTDALYFGETGDSALLILTRTALYTLTGSMQFNTLEGLAPIFAENKSPLSFGHLAKDQWIIGFGKTTLLVDIRKQSVVKTFNYRAAWTVCKTSDSSFLAGSFVKDSIALINARTGDVHIINHWKGGHQEIMGGYANKIMRADGSQYAVSTRYFGLYILNLADSSFIHIKHDPGNAASLRSDFLTQLYVSKSGTLFINAPGLSYTPLYPEQFKKVTLLSNEAGEKYKGVINCFLEDKDKSLWIGTNSHLVNWNRQTNTCRYFPYYQDNAGPLKRKTIRTLATDKLGRLWASAFGGGMGMLIPGGNFEQLVPAKIKTDNTLPGSEIYAITKDKDQQFIISCNRGFCRFVPETKTFETYYDHPKLKPIADAITYYAMTDRHDNLWLAQRTGLYCYNVSQDSLYTIALPPAIITKHMYTLAMDSTGNMYAGGFHGVYVIPDGRFAITKIIDKKSGLEGEYINGLLCDKNNRLWIIGNRGLAAYNTQNGALQVYNTEDGVLQASHKIQSFYLSPSGEAFTGSEDGFNYFNPAEIKPLHYPLKIFITSLQLPDSLITAAAFTHITLPYGDNNLLVNYLAVDFRLAAFIRYRYKLTGFDTNYVYAGRQRQARYTNLPAGKYHFVVEASVNGKDWTPAAQSLYFNIDQVFWKTWWFITLCVLAAAGIIYAFYRFRLQQVRKEAKLHTNYEIKLNELENSALRTQMNPHFIFNSLNTINAFINSNDRIQANQYISKFSKLVRLTLDHSRQKRIPLQDEVNVVTLYMELEQIRFQNCFQFTLDIKDIDTDITEVPPMIIQPFVENSILHGLLPKKEGGLLKIMLSKTNGHLTCVIEDNGIGRQATLKQKEQSGFNRKSHGMEITVKRIELFNKENGVSLPLHIIDLKDAQNNPGGTRVEIELALVESF